MIASIYHWYQYPFSALPTSLNVLVSLAIVAYFFYAIFYRIWQVYSETMEHGFFRGLYLLYIGQGKPIYETEILDNGQIRNKTIGYEPKYLRLYHLLWILIDLPCIMIGGCLPFLRRVFAFKLVKVSLPAPDKDKE